MALRDNLTIPARGRRRLQSYVRLLRRLSAAQLSDILHQYKDPREVSRIANPLFTGWHSSAETKREWEVPLAETHAEIDKLAQEPAFRAAIESPDFQGSTDEAVLVLKEVCQALIYDPRGEAETNVRALYAPFVNVAPWDSLGSFERDRPSSRTP